MEEVSVIDTSKWVLLFYIALSALWDISLYEIPNELHIAIFLAGFAISPSLAYIGVGAGLCLFFYLPFKLRFIGGGDVKLLSIIGAFLGAQPFLRCFICILLSAGVLSLLKLLSDGKVLSRLADLGKFTLRTIKLCRCSDYEQSQGRLVIPFSLAACIGYVIFLIR